MVYNDDNSSFETTGTYPAKTINKLNATTGKAFKKVIIWLEKV